MYVCVCVCLPACHDDTYTGEVRRSDGDSPACTGSDSAQTSQPSQPAGPKQKKPVRVYIDGCFDIMHSGHYNAIRQAKMLADVLVAGVHSDEEIIRNKGPPVMNNEERFAIYGMPNCSAERALQYMGSCTVTVTTVTVRACFLAVL